MLEETKGSRKKELLTIVQFWLLNHVNVLHMGFPCCSDSKESACNAGDLRSIPGSGRYPGEKEWQPIPVFLPGKSHGQRKLVGYSP